MILDVPVGRDEYESVMDIKAGYVGYYNTLDSGYYSSGGTSSSVTPQPTDAPTIDYSNSSPTSPTKPLPTTSPTTTNPTYAPTGSDGTSTFGFSTQDKTYNLGAQKLFTRQEVAASITEG